MLRGRTEGDENQHKIFPAITAPASEILRGPSRLVLEVPVLHSSVHLEQCPHARPEGMPSRWPYIPAPTRWGKYPVLRPEFAMTAYPPPLPVPERTRRPAYVADKFFSAPWHEQEVVVLPEAEAEPVKLGSVDEVKVRTAGAAVAKILRQVGRMIQPGVNTADIDRAVHAAVIDTGAYPSPLGYGLFPKSCTTSVNNVIAHGIPDDRPLHPEDIINVDLTIYLDGWHGDTSRTFLLPDVDKPGRDLVAGTEEAVELAIRQCGPGRPYNAIGKTIQDFAERHGFSVNTQFGGHGIGRHFHMPPWIQHHRNSDLGEMKPGDCFTIEPPLVQGSKSRGILWDDGWTMSTESGARSAQFEHQVLVTHDGVDVLTR